MRKKEKELPKWRLCIICGRLFSPASEDQYTHPECDEKEKEKENEKMQSGGLE